MKIYVDTKGIDNLAVKLAKLGNRAQAAVTDMLKAGSDVMIESLKEGVTKYGHDTPGKSGRATGGLKESIGLDSKGIRATDDGGQAIVTFNGADAHGERFGAIASYLNHGTSTIKADHWVDLTVCEAQPKAQEAMERKLNEHMNRE